MGMLAESVPWFPQDYAHHLFILNGSLALLSTLLLVFHMSEEWTESLRWGRRLRYLALLAFSSLVTAGAVEQLNQGALVNYRNLGATAAVLLLLLAMVVSIAERRRP